MEDRIINEAIQAAQAKAQVELQNIAAGFGVHVAPPLYPLPPSPSYARIAMLTAENERLADDLALAQAAVRLLQQHVDALSAMIPQAKAENAGQCGSGNSTGADAAGKFPTRALRVSPQPIGLVTPHG